MNNRKYKKPLRPGRSIRAGIRFGIFILTATCTVQVARLGWKTLESRIGAPGGELLIFPMIILLFYTGWTARKEWIAFKIASRKAERREYNARTSNVTAYKG